MTVVCLLSYIYLFFGLKLINYKTVNFKHLFDYTEIWMKSRYFLLTKNHRGKCHLIRFGFIYQFAWVFDNLFIKLFWFSLKIIFRLTWCCMENCLSTCDAYRFAGFFLTQVSAEEINEQDIRYFASIVILLSVWYLQFWFIWYFS